MKHIIEKDLTTLVKSLHKTSRDWHDIPDIISFIDSMHMNILGSTRRSFHCTKHTSRVWSIKLTRGDVNQYCGTLVIRVNRADTIDIYESSKDGYFLSSIDIYLDMLISELVRIASNKSCHE